MQLSGVGFYKPTSGYGDDISVKDVYMRVALGTLLPLIMLVPEHKLLVAAAVDPNAAYILDPNNLMLFSRKTKKTSLDQGYTFITPGKY